MIRLRGALTALVGLVVVWLRWLKAQPRGPRFYGLAYAAGGNFATGVAYTFIARKDELPGPLVKLDQFVPIAVYGVTWLLAGCCAVLLMVDDRVPHIARPCIGLPALVWSFAYFWASSDDHLNWQRGIIYLALSGMSYWASRYTRRASAEAMNR